MITVDPEIENIIRGAIHEDPIEGQVVGLDPDTHSRVVQSLLTAFTEARNTGFMPVYLVSPQIRSVTFVLLEREVPEPVVLSYNEIVPDIQVNIVTTALLSKQGV